MCNLDAVTRGHRNTVGLRANLIPLMVFNWIYTRRNATRTGRWLLDLLDPKFDV